MEREKERERERETEREREKVKSEKRGIFKNEESSLFIIYEN